MRAYEYRHIVGFEETSLVRNVYYVNYIRWQGRCREMFLRDHAPDVLQELDGELALVTTRVSCEFFAELRAFDEVVVRMRLGERTQNQVTMHFDYYRIAAPGDPAGAADRAEELVARGEQQVASMRRSTDGLRPTPLPATLVEALRPFGAS